MSKLVLPPEAPLDVARVDRDPARVYLASRVSEKTRQTMLEGLERIATILKIPLEQVPWADPRFDHAYTNAIRAELIKRYAPSTVQTTLVALKGVLKTAWRLKLIDAEQLARATDWDALRFTTLPAGRDLSREELTKLRAYCDEQEEPYGAFLRAIFAVLLGGGLRATELGSLTVDSFSAPAGTLRFVRKGKKEAIVGLGPGEAALVEQWIDVRKTLETSVSRLFVRVMLDGRVRHQRMDRRSVYFLCTDVAERAGLAALSPHDFRRTYCTTLLDAGLDLATAQRLMDHESPETTARYDRRTQVADLEARRRVLIWA